MSKLKDHIYFSRENSNYFHLALLLIIGIGVVAIVYFAYIFTLLNREEIFGNLWFDSLQEVSFSLLLDKPFYQSQYKVGDNINALVVLDAPLRKVSGVDVFLEYDPTYLEVKEINQDQKIDALRYLNTEFSEFKIFPYFKLDEERGHIIFSALTEPLKEFVGTNGKIAEITFKVLKKGNTEIKFRFKKNSSLDSNVASYGKDALNSVRNLKLSIE